MATVADLKSKISAAAESGDETSDKKRPRGRPALTPEQRAERDAKEASEKAKSEEAKAHVEMMLTRVLGEFANAITIKAELPPELDEQERAMFAEGAKPVLEKYLPGVLESIGPELIFGCTVWFIYGGRWMAKKARERKTQASSGGVGDRQNDTVEASFERVPPTGNPGPTP